jgi:glycosyltransferase involved in cell wall biosynthesis
VPIEAVPEALAAADIGLAPTRRSAFTDFSLSTKLFEYAAMGKPVVASALPMVERTFAPDTVRTYVPGDARGPGPACSPCRRPDRPRPACRTAELVRALAWDARPSVRRLIEPHRRRAILGFGRRSPAIRRDDA